MLHYLPLILLLGNINILDGHLILDAKIFLNNLLSLFKNKNHVGLKFFFAS